jgi:hypothetical protein
MPKLSDHAAARLSHLIIHETASTGLRQASVRKINNVEIKSHAETMMRLRDRKLSSAGKRRVIGSAYVK